MSLSAKFSRLLNFNVRTTYNLLVSRGKKQWMRPYLISLYKRRLDQGPEPDRPRTVWSNWNYDAELFSFGKRLGEEFKDQTLRTAFRTRLYVEKEKEQRKSLGVSSEADDFQLYDNEELVKSGELFISEYIPVFLKKCYPLLPEEGIKSITDYLVSDEITTHIASNLGIKDLILTSEFPPSAESLRRTFKAIIAALNVDQGQRRAEQFVEDFILTRLVGKRLDDIWIVSNPMGLLADTLKKQGKEEPEPRLLWSSGSKTILSTYMVGIYCNRKLIGKAPGETVTIAEEMAARDALRNIFDINQSHAELPFGSESRKLNESDINLLNSSSNAIH